MEQSVNNTVRTLLNKNASSVNKLMNFPQDLRDMLDLKCSDIQALISPLKELEETRWDIDTYRLSYAYSAYESRNSTFSSLPYAVRNTIRETVSSLFEVASGKTKSITVQVDSLLRDTNYKRMAEISKNPKTKESKAALALVKKVAEGLVTTVIESSLTLGGITKAPKVTYTFTYFEHETGTSAQVQSPINAVKKIITL